MECERIKQGKPNYSMEEFKKATLPAIEFLQKYCCPHDTIIIDMAAAELVNGAVAYSVEVPD